MPQERRSFAARTIPNKMRISWTWLQQYIDIELDPHEAAEILTSTGLEVENVTLHEPIPGMLKGVVVGHVLSCGKHPDADRLSVCKVDVGAGEDLTIVCGAPNVAAGQKVLVATVGANLCMSDGTCIIIKKSKIRGQDSHGMICAEDELGLGQGHDGILVLAPNAEIGRSAAEQLGLKSDHVLEIGLTPNRADAMGHIGVARDLVAALAHRTGSSISVQWPVVEPFEKDGADHPIAVEVLDTTACPRYAGVVLTGINVAPSPTWLAERLETIGLKPINNVVDVTNFVQHELGLPLHAFDLERMKEGRVVVRKARPNEAFTTLDGKERKLDDQDLVIADASDAACIAGVFGGERSGVSNSTTTLFLESAYFDPASIRRTARRHGLNTDASFRFERGVDPERTVYALKRAALLLKEVAGARISSEVVDIDNRVPNKHIIELKFAACDALTGVVIPPDRIVGILTSLDIQVLERDEQGVRVQVPPYRVDVTRSVDLIEEILRIHGFDEVPVPERLMCPPVQQPALTQEGFRKAGDAHLVARGFREIMTPSLTNGVKAKERPLHSKIGFVELANPLSAELDVLRSSMLPGALQAMAYNLNRQQRDLRFFERGRVYSDSGSGITETGMLALTMTGSRYSERWRSADRKTELADIKEEVEGLLSRMGLIDRAEWNPTQHPDLTHAHVLLLDGKEAGLLGAVDRPMLAACDVGQPTFFAELQEEVLLSACASSSISFKELSKYPAVKRDLSLLIDTDVRFGTLKKAALHAERKLLRDVDLFDVYEGDKLPKGKKSYALRFILQDTERTLTDEQVEKAMMRIRSAFQKEVGAELRS